MPVWGRQYQKYGGMTTCYSLETAEGLLLVDAGSGISNVTTELINGNKGLPITILFTHFHLDHVMGLPFFDLLYDKDTHITLVGDSSRDDDWRAALAGIMEKPYWPVPLQDAGATIEFKDLPTDTNQMEIYGVPVSWTSINHPQGCLSYRLKTKHGDVVLATDVERGDQESDKRFVEFAKDTDVLIHDAQYTTEEYASHKGWGHATWKDAAEVALEANAKKLLLTHHSPLRTDDEIDALSKKASGIFPNTEGAAEGTVLFS